MKNRENNLDLARKVSKYLIQMGMTPNMDGYRYLREAILRTVNDWDTLRGITKILYPELAKQFNVRPCSIEQNIRRAIEASWNKSNCGGFFGTSKPSNKEFIAMIADMILLDVE